MRKGNTCSQKNLHKMFTAAYSQQPKGEKNPSPSADEQMMKCGLFTRGNISIHKGNIIQQKKKKGQGSHMCFCLDESGNRMLSENHSSHQSPRVCDSIYVKPGQQRGEQADGVTPEGCRVVFWGEEHVLKWTDRGGRRLLCRY